MNPIIVTKLFVDIAHIQIFIDQHNLSTTKTGSVISEVLITQGLWGD